METEQEQNNNNHFIRSDSRTPLDLRTLNIKTSILSRSDGSAQFSLGNLQTLASINGPVEVKIKDEKPNESTIEVNLSTLSGSNNPQTKSLNNLIKHLFKSSIDIRKHPRSLIQINLQTLSNPIYKIKYDQHRIELFKKINLNCSNQQQGEEVEEDGDFLKKNSRMMNNNNNNNNFLSEKAALINVTTIACLDTSSINLKNMIISIGICIIENHNNNDQEQMVYLIDPDPREESLSDSNHLFVFKFDDDDGDQQQQEQQSLVFIESLGSFDLSQLKRATELALISTKQIYDFIRLSFQFKFQKNITIDSSQQQQQQSFDVDGIGGGGGGNRKDQRSVGINDKKKKKKN